MRRAVHCIEETWHVAEMVAKKGKPGDVIRLYGEMGVGKTAFVQGFVRALGIEETVSSPTFSILNIYEGQVPVYHFDLYRIEDEQEIFEAGLYEYIGADGISIIEWPQMMEEYPTVRLIDVTMEKNLKKGEDFRVITVKGIDEF